jgi:hypothetical protein
MHHDWERGERIAAVESPWVRLIAERWRDEAGRKLGLPPAAIGELRQLNREGWPVNSSFSDQLLFGVVAAVDPAASPSLPYETAPTDRDGLTGLLRRLECLQCRAVVLELLLAAG